ncbi:MULTISPECIES: hypothetical protein [Microbacterium]|uniref:Uncharacterized protein n=1 Tax=Microbacterium paraoxydans TaxID=199592 RepID=A0ABZ2HTQ4_9MICO|nr:MULTISPECIES: hypothetical protein [Microbacterium]AMG83350.1 hypothetical protein AXH82_08195 [Microbacterium sp. PAMC 28756]KYK00155.1 hypothetical protein AUV07_05355 [Microbacterium sp. CH1]MCT1394797.1 hypothetical protein [Microbacterium sp. p3-SID338]OSP08797.1 hypothetical protein B7W94_03955 [Microbacterium sp. LEMMJ01]PMC05103.1 hypothetical protein CJ226_05775 [Microbacterium sp. UMB0228]
MPEPLSLEEASYIRYADLLARLEELFPSVSRRRIEQIIAAETDAITGGLLRIVPAEVETGAMEMLEREAGSSDEGEVA